MKNSGTDYFTQLRSDFIPKEKNNPGNHRRVFNPGDPNELKFIPAKQPAPGEVKAPTFSSGILQTGKEISS